MKRALGAAILALTTTLSRRAHAQVNAEALRSTLEKYPNFLWVDAGLVGRAGNTQTTTFSGSVFGGVTHEPHLFFAKASADYGHAAGTTNVARWLTHARYNYRLTELLALEGLAQAQHDRFQRLAVRDLYGAGIRVALWTETDLEVFAGTTYLLEHEVISDVPGSPGGAGVYHRSSSYAGVDLKVNPFADLSSVTYVQPRFDKPQNLRVLHETILVFTITKMLAARISGSVWYYSEPPDGVRTYDVEVKNTLALKFF